MSWHSVNAVGSGLDRPGSLLWSLGNEMTAMLRTPLQVSLRDFTEADRSRLDDWARCINSTSYMTRYMPRPDTCLMWFVIEVHGIEVGTLWLEHLPEPGQANLGILLGDASVFGQGIGKKAIRLAITRARRFAGLRVLRLHVRNNNIRAIACYKRCGFRIVDSLLREVGGKSYRVLTMERPLGDDDAT